jgi:gliding motility-associated-like protein
LSASGGVTYSWTPTSTLNNPSIANPVATPASSVKYYVTVTDANNCSNQDSITITVSSASTKSVSGPSGVCPGDSVQLVASGGDQYQWQPSGSLSNPTIANPKASPSATTTYTVAITDLACNSVSNLTKTVTVLTLPTIRASKLNDLDCSTDQTLLAATGGISYLWTPATTLNNPGIANPTAKPVVTTLYKVKGTDAAGCSNYDSVIVNVSATGKGLYLMPTGFTPNNDGKNDCYGIKGWGAISEVEFSIFNRWGQRIFFTKNPTDCWNGKVNGLEQTPGVFIYMVKAKSSCENAIFRKGSFMLIR